MPLQLLRPRRWRPPAAPARARETQSNPPLPPLRMLALPGDGPEDVVVDRGGMLLTGIDDGRVLRIDPQTGAWDEVANTGGRPLGLKACPDGSILCSTAWTSPTASLVPQRFQPAAEPTVWAIAVSWDGEIRHDRQGSVAGFSMVTSAIERDGRVYPGSLHGAAIAAFEL